MRVSPGYRFQRHPGYGSELRFKADECTMQDDYSELAAARRLAAAGPDFQVLHEIILKARENLSQNDWDYIVGATKTETTLRRNRLALDCLGFRPRVLRDVGQVDAAVTTLGHRLRLPVVL